MLGASITEGDIEALAELFAGAGEYVAVRHLSDYWLYARLFSSTSLCVCVMRELWLRRSLRFAIRPPESTRSMFKTWRFTPNLKGPGRHRAVFELRLSHGGIR
jgi:hypothetical protein